MKTVLAVLATAIAITATGAAAEKLSPADPADYGFAYWLNGFRKHTGDESKDILCFETGRFAMALDLKNLPAAWFGKVEPRSGYEEAVKTRRNITEELPLATLDIEIIQDGTTYRATRCFTGPAGKRRHLQSARMWESGRLAQHFELQDVVFEDAAGNALPCDTKIFVMVWPGSLTLRAEVTPSLVYDESTPTGEGKPQAWNNASMRIRLKNSEQEWSEEQPASGAWSTGSTRSITLNCDITEPPEQNAAIEVRTADGQTIHAEFDPGYYCYKAEVQSIKRNWNGGYTDIRNYDEFTITIDNPQTQSARLPFLFYFRNPANITGLCPILCDTNGVPTGIPVQLSKNWHYEKLGAYLRAYAMLPAAPGKTTYTLRIAYGFYGSLPSASHAQLSLVGYGGHGRWDQLAIGCWGETICFDMDMSCVDVAITDVRMLMARNGRNGKMWGWTDAGWGGDWLNLQDGEGNKLYFSEMKTAYLSHGPCLSEVHHDGFYGSDRQVDLQTTIRTLRTDDYARTFQTLRYEFKKPVSTHNGWLFKMGRTGGYVTPRIAWGNRSGLIKERLVPKNLTAEEVYLPPFDLTGSSPWWIAFPGAHHNNTSTWGTGSRALIIRSYHASINGKEYTTPTISFPVCQVHKTGETNLDMLMTPPEGVEQFLPGDTITFEVEWITPHREADDYYGPNESYRAHLGKYPSSWKTVYREAQGNDLKVQVRGGTLRHSYPVIIDAEQENIAMHITGGVGAVPVRFEKLPSMDYTLFRQTETGSIQPLDQSVHGNDFWQTDYDPASGTYSITFNLQLDDTLASTWILKKRSSNM